MMNLLIIFFSFCFNQDIPHFDENRAMDLLKKQCSFGPRYPGSLGYVKMKVFLSDFLSNLSDSLYVLNEKVIHPKYHTQLELTNYLSRFNLDAQYRIMFMAHWDTREFADKDPDINNRSLPILGANDGASGVAALLTLAEIINRFPPLNIGIDLLFIDGEDQGITGKSDSYGLGSQAFAKNIPGISPQFAICLDMIADNEPHFLIEYFSYKQAPELVDEIWTLANMLGYFQFEKKIGHAVMDDHYYFYENSNIPAINIIDFDYPNSNVNYWHTLHDIPENCSAKSLGIVGSVVTYFIYKKDNEIK